MSCFPAVNTPSPCNQSFVRYPHSYILFLLFHHLQFSITIELFSKTSFTLLDSYRENAVDLLICPREKCTLSSHKRLFQHLCHLSRRYNHYIPNTGLCLPCRHKSSKEFWKINQFTHGSNTPNRTKFKIILAFRSATSLPFPPEFQIPHSNSSENEAIKWQFNFRNSTLNNTTCSYQASVSWENMTHAWLQYLYNVHPMLGFNIYTIFTRTILLGK